MEDLVFHRGSIVAFTEQNEKKLAVNIQNGAGNRFAPTIIVAEVELVSTRGERLSTVVPLEQYPTEEKQMVVNLGKIKTIDKKRVQSIMGQLHASVQDNVDKRLNDLVRFDEERQGQVIFVNLGKDIMGSEQGGERPAVVLKSFEQNEDRYFLVALMTSKMAKRPIPTHVMYEEGEGGIAKPSLALFEQLKYVKVQDVTDYYEYTPSRKLPNIRKAFHISVGISKKIKSGA